MGGAEDGLFKACNEAAEVGADCVLTIGGGAVQDAGKFVRLWLSATMAEERIHLLQVKVSYGIISHYNQSRMDGTASSESVFCVWLPLVYSDSLCKGQFS